MVQNKIVQAGSISHNFFVQFRFNATWKCTPLFECTW